MKAQNIVSREQWLVARKALLEGEKAWTKERDRLSTQRRALPWVKVEDYVFDSPIRPVALSQLFDGRSQLIVYHFMFDPEWTDGCPSCSFLVDHVEGAQQHFEHRDISFACISRAPIEKIEAYKRRMGWRFQWVSSFRNRFNFDFHVSFTPEMRATGAVEYNFEQGLDPEINELPGLSVFALQPDGAIYHTYSSYARGGEVLLGTYDFIDLGPKGRQEDDEIMNGWMHRHNEYPDDGRTASGKKDK